MDEWQKELTEYNGVQETSLDAYEGLIEEGTFEQQVGMVLTAIETLDRPCDHEIRAYILENYKVDLPNSTISARRNAIPGVYNSGKMVWSSGKRNRKVIRWNIK